MATDDQGLTSKGHPVSRRRRLALLLPLRHVRRQLLLRGLPPRLVLRGHKRACLTAHTGGG